MRRLQRAVNNKDKDIQDLKADFEKAKKLLDIMVKEIKEKEERQAANANSRSNLSGFSGGGMAAVHHSAIMSGYNRDTRFN